MMAKGRSNNEIDNFYLGNMEEKKSYFNLLKSRTFWTLCAMFVINGFTGIRESLPAGVLPYVDGLFSILTIYFAKVSPKVGKVG